MCWSSVLLLILVNIVGKAEGINSGLDSFEYVNLSLSYKTGWACRICQPELVACQPEPVACQPELVEGGFRQAQPDSVNLTLKNSSLTRYWRSLRRSIVICPSSLSIKYMTSPYEEIWILKNLPFLFMTMNGIVKSTSAPQLTVLNIHLTNVF